MHKKSIKLIYRHPNPGFFSIEKVFDSVKNEFSSDYNLNRIVLPFPTKGLFSLIANLVYLSRHKSEYVHITGDLHYGMLALSPHKTILTIHDLVFLQKATGLRRKLLTWLFVKMPVKRAQFITTISEKSKQEIIDYSGCIPTKIHVIPNPVDRSIQYIDKLFNSEQPILLFIGTKENKNLENTIAALSVMSVHLRIIGKLSSTQQLLLDSSNINYSSVWNISDLQMAQEYANCDIVLFPSTYEGFGLPIIEGFQSGRVVITSNVSPMKEVSDGAAFLIDPHSIESIREAVLSIIQDSGLRETLIQKGFERVKAFQPDQIAKQYDRVYGLMLNLPQPNYSVSPKLKLLLFTDWFSPAFKAGGSVRSVVNLVDRFKEEYGMYVFTSDRDLNNSTPFDDIVADEWIARDGIHLYYYSPGKMTYALVKSTITDIAPDKIYLNSMFSNMILPIRAAYQSGKIVLAPRGMLRPSALAVKPIRKFFYLSLLKLFSIERSISFHSTGIDETKNIKRIFPLATKIIEAPNLPVPVSVSLVEKSKEVGAVKLIFVGRIHPIKNLYVLLEALDKVKGEIQLTIVATLEDLTYWEKCKDKIQELQECIQVNLMIDLPHHEIKQHIEQAHFFVLPTEGENFGHAIFEALAVGCPIIISDQTPWRNLASEKAGFDLSLQDLNSFSNAIQSCIDMDNDVWQEYRHGAWNEAKRYSAEMNPELSYFQLFNT